jgi:hypothetical protein
MVGALLISGCASSAVRPPTPAAQIRTEELLQTPPAPNERYYLILFGSENWCRQPRHVHSWATMVRVVSDSCCRPIAIEPHTISWGPAKCCDPSTAQWEDQIRPWHFKVVPGFNMPLHPTIHVMLKAKQNITMWGPYEVWHGNFIRFMTQKAFMESGQVGYQCIDNVGEAAKTGTGCDCIHSVSDMDPSFAREQYPLTYFGVPATRNIVNEILRRPVVINAPQTHDWLIPCIGLDRYPIKREIYSGPVVAFTPEAMQASLAKQACDNAKKSRPIWPFKKN